MKFHRKIKRFSLFPILLVTLWSLAITAQSASKEIDFDEKITTPELVKQLQAGGFVIYMRHGNTDNSRPDRRFKRLQHPARIESKRHRGHHPDWQLYPRSKDTGRKGFH